MAQPAVRAGGVWKRQEDARAELQRRLEESDALLRTANGEVDRVHAQCVVLLRQHSELTIQLGEAETQLRRRDEELHAAKQNVAELMALLTHANEDRVRLEQERSAATALWHRAREQEQHTNCALKGVSQQRDEEESEAQRLRDLLYEAQEQNECHARERALQERQLRVLVHSHEAKDRQVVTLVRERDSYAQKLAQYRSRISEDRLLLLPRPRTSPQPPQRAVLQRVTSTTTTEASNEDVTWTEENQHIEDVGETGESEAETRMSTMVSDAAPTVASEQEKQRLRVIAQQAKARVEREKKNNAALQKRIEALEQSHEELLVRFRQASKLSSRRRMASVGTKEIPLCRVGTGNIQAA